jgi:hypothetical protein
MQICEQALTPGRPGAVALKKAWSKQRSRISYIGPDEGAPLSYHKALSLL